MSAEEKLALELRNEWLANDPLASWAGSNDPLWLALARHVLRRERAAVRRARRESVRLRAALRFYANANAYLYQGDIHLVGSAIVDAGCIARVTLDGGDPLGNAERSLRRAKAKGRVVAVPRRGGRK